MHYVAKRQMTTSAGQRMPGDQVPEAADWPRAILDAHLAGGWLEEVDDDADPAEAAAIRDAGPTQGPESMARPAADEPEPADDDAEPVAVPAREATAQLEPTPSAADTEAQATPVEANRPVVEDDRDRPDAKPSSKRRRRS